MIIAGAAGVILLLATGLWVASPALGNTDPYEATRQRMMEHDLRGRDITDLRVLAAMARVPRHLFVDPSLAPLAYGDFPLPIAGGQTISQPYIVALMTQWAEIQPGHKVLEVGTGSGYQAAVLACLTDRVYSIELIPELAQGAAARLAKLGYSQVQVRSGDGYQGWPEQAPFDAILVTAAAPEIPAALKAQLREGGGRLIMPLKTFGGFQTLIRLTRHGNRFITEDICPVRFVPLVKPDPKRSKIGERP
ncbi:MAG: protein-L-isoaspartate(D-aspartate) O-methyltransferase [Desulfobacca sp.]|nr:protein-L-isoaspartate(D-aspartate) O-methyltransferase [Desulfobacca sp.]